MAGGYICGGLFHCRFFARGVLQQNPYFLLTPYCRTRALLLGGVEITRYELRLLIRLWHMRSLGSLARIADASHRPPARNPWPLPSHTPATLQSSNHATLQPCNSCNPVSHLTLV